MGYDYTNCYGCCLENPAPIFSCGTSLHFPRTRPRPRGRNTCTPGCPCSASVTQRISQYGEGGGRLPAAGVIPAKGKSGRKALVLYHSRTGNTRALARQIHEAVGGDLVEIQTVQPYPDDYDALVAQNAEEQRTNYMPPSRTTIENIQDYDVIFIGSPIWNVRLTPPVRSFLSSHDLSGKIIAPFVTYKVSGLGRSSREYRRITPRKHHFGRPLRYLVEPARQSPRCRAGLRALDEQIRTSSSSSRTSSGGWPAGRGRAK